MRDICNAFLTAPHATKQSNGTWRVEGVDEDGIDLTVIVAVSGRIEVITVY
jgi:hypothetical protein